MEAAGLNKRRWTLEEDEKLRTYIEQHGIGIWRWLPAKAGLQRSGKACRLRWTNYLRPDIKRGKFSLTEEMTIIQLHALLGNRWSAIARRLRKRTENEIKNHWNTHLKKRLANKGIDPVTHEPRGSDDAPGETGGGAAMGAQQHGKHPTDHLSSHHTVHTGQPAARARALRRLRVRLGAAAAAADAQHHQTSLSLVSNLSLVSESATALASVLQEAHSGFAALAARAAMQLHLQPVVPAYEEAARRKDGQLQQQRWGDQVVDVADAGIAAAAFAGVLLDESLHQEQAEVEKKYWVFIMNLVNSSPSSASSSSLQTSVAMPPPAA